MDPHFISGWNAGDQIGPFQFVAFSGRGSYGEVLIVRDLQNELFALKILDCSNENLQRELNGILRIRKKISSPALVAIHYTARLPDGRFYYVMDAADNLSAGEDGPYVPDTLEQRLRRNGPMEKENIFSILTKLLHGLKSLHDAGLAHRDIKPENIIFRHGEPVLSDCGLVAQTDSASTLTGTPGFLPPEALSVKPDPVHWDLYALGKVMYCMWTGLDSADYPAIPPDRSLKDYKVVRKIYSRACSETIRNRFADADEFLLALQKPVRNRSTGKKIILYGAVGICFLLLLVVCFFSSRRKNNIPAERNTQKPAKTAESPKPAVKTAEEIRKPENGEPEFQTVELHEREIRKQSVKKTAKTYEELREEPFFLTERDAEVYTHVVGHCDESVQQSIHSMKIHNLQLEADEFSTTPERLKEIQKEIQEHREWLEAFSKTPAGILSKYFGRRLEDLKYSPNAAEEYLEIRDTVRKALEDYKKTHNDWQNCLDCRRNRGEFGLVGKPVR